MNRSLSAGSDTGSDAGGDGNGGGGGDAGGGGNGSVTGEAWSDFMRLAGIKGKQDIAKGWEEKMTKENVRDAYAAAGRREWGSDSYMERIVSALENVNCIWISEWYGSKRQLALKPTQVFLTLEGQFNSFSMKSNAFNHYKGVFLWRRVCRRGGGRSRVVSHRSSARAALTHYPSSPTRGVCCPQEINLKFWSRTRTPFPPNFRAWGSAQASGNERGTRKMTVTRFSSARSG